MGITDSPTICMRTLALSSRFSICSTSSYVPECSRSAARMNRMVSTLELRTLTILGSTGWPSLYQVATGRGLPWKYPTQHFHNASPNKPQLSHFSSLIYLFCFSCYCEVYVIFTENKVTTWRWQNSNTSRQRVVENQPSAIFTPFVCLFVFFPFLFTHIFVQVMSTVHSKVDFARVNDNIPQCTTSCKWVILLKYF